MIIIIITRINNRKTDNANAYASSNHNDDNTKS